MSKKMKQEMFSPERVALMREVNKHPVLASLLAAQGDLDWPAQLGEIAAYCNIVMDGYYSPMDLDRLCGMLVWKLKEKGIILIN